MGDGDQGASFSRSEGRFGGCWNEKKKNRSRRPGEGRVARARSWHVHVRNRCLEGAARDLVPLEDWKFEFGGTELARSTGNLFLFLGNADKISRLGTERVFRGALLRFLRFELWVSKRRLRLELGCGGGYMYVVNVVSSARVQPNRGRYRYRIIRRHRCGRRRCT